MHHAILLVTLFTSVVLVCGQSTIINKVRDFSLNKYSYVVNQDNSFLLFWNNTGNKITLFAVAKTNGWLAVGISQIGDMIGSTAIVGRNQGPVVEVRSLLQQNPGDPSTNPITTTQENSGAFIRSSASMQVDGPYSLLQFTLDFGVAGTPWGFAVNPGTVRLIFGYSATAPWGYHQDTRYQPTASFDLVGGSSPVGSEYANACDCLNGGSCSNSLFSCTCVNGFSGPTCAIAPTSTTGATQTPTPTPLPTPSPIPQTSPTPAASLESRGYTSSIQLISTDLVVYWKPVTAAATKMSFAVQGKSTGFVAMGFSSSGLMIGSDAVIGWQETNGAANVRSFFLVNKTTPGITPNTKMPITDTAAEINNGYTTIFFTRDVSSGAVPIDLSKPNVIIGSYQSNNVKDLIYHGATRKANVEVTFAPISVTSTGSPQTSTTGGAVVPPSDPSSSGYTMKTTIPNQPITIYWKPLTSASTSISFAVRAPTTGFVGLGFSPDGKMIGSDAVIGWVERNGSPNIAAYKLVDKSTGAVSTSTYSITDTAVTEVGGMTTIYFTRVLNSGAVPIPLTTTQFFVSSYSSDNLKGLGYHGSTRGTVRVDNLLTGAVTEVKEIPWRQIHASIMFISWSIMLTFGMLFARYSRHYPNLLWFKVHRATQYSGYSLAVIGFIFAFVAGQGNHFGFLAHSVLGTLIMTFGLAQVVGAYFRPHKEAGKPVPTSRKLFEYLHWWNGRSLVMAVILQTILGLYILSGGSKDFLLLPFYITLAALVFLGIIALEFVVGCCPRKEWKVTPCCFCYPPEDNSYQKM